MNEPMDSEFFAFENDKYLVGFPERIEYVISGDEALRAIKEAQEKITGFRDDELHIFKTVIGALAPQNIRDIFQTLGLNKVAIPYSSIVSTSGKILSLLVLLGLEDNISTVQENQRLIILSFLEQKFREKIKRMETEKPVGWRIYKKFYEMNLSAITPLVDNLMNLIVLAWVFCPGIGEPDKETGYYNRFVFTGNGGFIDLGHFFNCAIISYLYGSEEATKRGEATEVGQRWLRQKEMLTKLHERRIFDLVTNLLWGYATSADTIEDRASDKFGIFLGEAMRKHEANAEVMEYFMALYPEMVRESLDVFSRPTFFRKIWNLIKMIFKNLYFTLRDTDLFDINQYMQEFFDEYDAIDPADSDTVPKGLFKTVIDFYAEKYGGAKWDSYTNTKWRVVIPQVLWERVVRGRKKFGEKGLPIGIQLKDTGKIVPVYDGEPPK